MSTPIRLATEAESRPGVGGHPLEIDMTDIETKISSHLVPEADRVNFVHGLFGLHFPLCLEPTVFNMAGMLAKDYCGGYWQFYALSNGGFYMAPDAHAFEVVCENGYVGQLSGEALGITACLYAFSHLSFGGDVFAEVCAEHYHLLREYALGHPEARGILAAID